MIEVKRLDGGSVKTAQMPLPSLDQAAREWPSDGKTVTLHTPQQGTFETMLRIVDIPPSTRKAQKTVKSVGKAVDAPLATKPKPAPFMHHPNADPKVYLCKPRGGRTLASAPATSSSSIAAVKGVTPASVGTSITAKSPARKGVETSSSGTQTVDTEDEEWEDVAPEVRMEERWVLL